MSYLFTDFSQYAVHVNSFLSI